MSSTSTLSTSSSKYDCYFTRVINVDPNMYQWACKICGYLTAPTIHTTTEIRRHHLRTKHPAEFCTVETRKPKPPPIERKRKIKDNIAANVLVKKFNGENDQNSDKIDNAIMELISTANMPLSVISHPAFDRLIKLLNPIYILSNTDYFIDTKLPELYSKISTQIAAITSTLDNYSFVIAEFEESNFSHSILSTTLHFLDDELKPKYFILSIQPINKYKIIEKLPQKLEEIFIEFGLDWSKVTHFIQGGSSGSTNLNEVQEWDVEKCLGLGLQQCVEEAMNTVEGLDTVVLKTKKLIRKLAKSKLFNQIFADYQKLEQLPSKFLDPDIPILWEILFSIFLLFQESKINLQILCVQNGFKEDYTLDQNEWDLLDQFIETLSGFRQATTLLARPDTTISSIIPIIKVIMLDLETKKKSGKGNVQLVDGLLESLKARFSDALVNQNNIIATLLDPRFKDKYLSPSSNGCYKDWIIQELIGNLDTVILPKMEILDEDNNEKEEDDLFALFEKSNESKNVMPVGDEKKQIIEAELIKYLHEPRISRESLPSEYWHSNSSRFPYLKQLFCKHATAPVSNVEMEKLLSLAGTELDQMRKNLTNQTFKKLLFLNLNFKLLDLNVC